MPGLRRSFQPWMCFGLPCRVTKTTTESVTMPLYRSSFQVFGTSPALTRRVMSGSSENSTTSADSPFLTARLCSPDAPYDCVKETPLPAAVFWKAGMIWAYASFGVEPPTRVRLAPLPLALAAVPTIKATRADAAIPIQRVLIRLISFPHFSQFFHEVAG